MNETRISLIGTVHEEKGLSSVSELLAILERIRPDVIFAEIPSADFADYLTGTRSNLESTAARRYRKRHDAVLVPVDLPTPDGDFFSNSQFLYEQINKISPDYRRLIDWHSQCVSAEGFTYLNSERCSELWSAVYEAMAAAIQELGERRLIEFYTSWKNMNELREKAMLKNIEDYCVQNPFRSGAFLVGAAHRHSVIAKLRGRCDVVSAVIEWDYSGFLDHSK